MTIIRDCIVVDLDGTLCNSSHRDHLAVAGQWDEFHSALVHDTPWEDVATFIRYLGSDNTIIALTGRNERYRQKTLNWLSQNDIQFDHILMRPDDNFTSDTVVKPAMLQELFGGSMERAKKQVLMILEDRDKMVEAWRNLGFRCWQVQPGGY